MGRDTKSSIRDGQFKDRYFLLVIYFEYISIREELQYLLKYMDKTIFKNIIAMEQESYPMANYYSYVEVHTYVLKSLDPELVSNQLQSLVDVLRNDLDNTSITGEWQAQ